MQRDWVIDTWVLATANDPQAEQALEALHFLTTILESHTIVLDHQREIDHEYRTYIQPRTHVEKWWHRLNSVSGKIERFDNRVPQQHEQQLVNDLKFDRSDLKFIGVALRTSSNLLVSEDSDYNPEIQTYLNQNFQITVCTLQIARNIANT